MRLLILFVVLLILLAVFYKTSGGYFIAPTVVYCAMYAFAIFVCLCSRNWVFYPSELTIVVIITGIVFWGGLQPFAKKLMFSRIMYLPMYDYRQKRQSSFIIAIISMFCLVLYASFIISIGGGLSLATIQNARIWLLYNSPSNIYGHAMLFSRAAGCVFVFFIAKKKIIECTKIRVTDMIPVVCYLLMEIISTSRSGIIYFLGYIIVCVSMIRYKKNDGKVRASKEIKKVIIRVTVIVLVAFVGLGYLTGKTKKLGAFNMVSVYFGGSIYDLNFYLDNMNKFQSPGFGYFTMPIVNSVKSALGIAYPILDEFYLPFVPVQLKIQTGFQTASNLYTSLTKPILDYGIIGSAFFWIILGSFYLFLFYYVLNRKGVGMGIILYSYIMMPVFCASSEYVFGSFLFSPSAVYSLVYLYFVFKLCTNKTLI